MATKRVTHTFRKGDILEVKEYHDGRYGARGLPREKKRKPTPEQMAVVNAMNKAETARHRLLEYFGKEDYFLTLTYRVEARPPDMAKAKKDFTNLISKLRTRYKKEQIELRWIRNIEKGTKGAWHIHMVITGCRDTIRWVEECWPHGGIYAESTGEKQILRRGFLTARILHHQKREGGRKEGGWKEGQAKTQRIQLQHFEEHATETTKEEKTGKMAKRDQTEDRLLHC